MKHIHIHLHDAVRKPVRRAVRDCGCAACRAKDVGEDLIGQIVRFKLPGVNGPMRKAGTVKRVMPNGQFEVKGQEGGYYTFSRSEIKTRSEWDAEMPNDQHGEEASGGVRG